MLTLKSGAYTLDDYRRLYAALCAAYVDISCDDNCDCPSCPHRRACEDIAKLMAHVTRKTRELEAHLDS